MSPRHPVAQSRSVLLAAGTLALVMVQGSSAEASSLGPVLSSNPLADVPSPRSPRRTPGLLTDRLSPKQQRRWRSIVELVFAEDDLGRPLHPTLRAMWDEVATSGHDVYVELAAPSLSHRYAAGLFEIESVDPQYHVVAVVRLDLQAIDRAAVGTVALHGFPRFRGLAREWRYAEVLGHELGHAVWTLADPQRAHHVLALQGQLTDLTRSLLKAKGDERAEIRRRLRGLSQQAEALETPAREAEARVWKELVAGQANSARSTRSTPPDRATLYPDQRSERW